MSSFPVSSLLPSVDKSSSEMKQVGNRNTVKYAVSIWGDMFLTYDEVLFTMVQREMRCPFFMIY
jgi:hypothetical protein